MPVFNEIRINQSHLSKVKIKKQEIINSQELSNTPQNNSLINDFHIWRSYVSNVLKRDRLTSTRIVYV